MLRTRYRPPIAPLLLSLHCKFANKDFKRAAGEEPMSTRLSILAALALFISTAVLPQARAERSNPSSQSSNDTVEGYVVSTSRETLVVRTDDNQFQLFTYERPSVRPSSLPQGTRVRVTAGTADENGTRAASNVEVVGGNSGRTGTSTDKGAQTAPVPQQVRDLEGDIRREAKRWRLGVRAGAAFDPELFMFGVHSQIGPIFHPRVQFRPNAEFAFGEVTDLIALNLEAIYRFSSASHIRNWTPYVGAGPALIFIHQNFEQGRDIDFGNFDYETGFNVLVGAQSRRGAFVELKTSLYSGPAPKLRLIVGYTF
jgi:hypothetical protein